MRRGCQIGDYIVTIGTTALFNVKLYDDRLVVRLLDSVSSYTRGDDIAGCGDLYPVRVRTTAYNIY